MFQVFMYRGVNQGYAPMTGYIVMCATYTLCLSNRGVTGKGVTLREKDQFEIYIRRVNFVYTTPHSPENQVKKGCSKRKIVYLRKDFRIFPTEYVINFIFWKVRGLRRNKFFSPVNILFGDLRETKFAQSREFFVSELQCFLSFKYIQVKQNRQIMNSLLLNNFYPVIVYGSVTRYGPQFSCQRKWLNR